MQFKTDKRSLRTRNAIKLSLLKIVRNKEISDISVVEITRLAEINRNSFYTHYKNISDILDDINNDIILFTEGILKKYTYASFVDDPYPVISEFTNAISSNKYFSEYLLFSKSSAELINKLKNSMYQRCYDTYVKERGSAKPIVGYMIAYVLGGIFEVYRIWFMTEREMTLDEVTQKISECIKKGIYVMREVKNRG